MELVTLNKKLFTILFILTSTSLLLFSCSAEDSAPKNEITENEVKNKGHELEDEFSNGSDEENKNADQSHNQVTEPALKELPRDFFVGIYSGQGSWYESAEATRRFLENHDIKWDDFDEEDALDHEEINRFDLLWFPGGFAAEYKNYIKDHAIIRDFVHEGGLFVGSCAGAYYASAILNWQGTGYEYPLDFFEGKGSGPIPAIAYGEATTIYLDDEHPVNQDFNSITEMYYFDGPYFEPADDENITVLARYRVNEEPAIIGGKSGDGSYLLLGPHPELGGYSEASSGFNLDGEDGARWQWLYALLKWFGSRYDNR